MKYRIKETGVIVEKENDWYWTMEDNKRIYSCGPNCLKQLGLTIEPYVEPVKKLYAFKNEFGRVIFFASEYMIKDHHRAPEFDLTYPKEQ